MTSEQEERRTGFNHVPVLVDMCGTEAITGMASSTWVCKKRPHASSRPHEQQSQEAQSMPARESFRTFMSPV